MLCDVCQTITPELLHSKQPFPLHSRWKDVVSSAKAGCCICGWISNDERISEQNTNLEESGCWAQGSTSYTLSGANSRTALSIGSLACIGGNVAHGEFIEIAKYSMYITPEVSLTSNPDGVTGRPISQYASSKRCFDLARKWITECLQDHGASCPLRGEAELPTRLLDLRTADNTSDDLCLRVTGQQLGAWVALSHCWGASAKIHYTTTTLNIEERQRGMRFTDLPQTFQDAVIVTRALGYRYLWIDSLCILQDDLTDWVKESSQMRRYYKNAILSIAADVSAGDEEGFLGHMRNNSQGLFDTEDISPCEAHINIRDLIKVPRLSGDTCLSRRAWTLQEDLLSSRTLHYTEGQIVWECQASKYCESDTSELGDDDNYIFLGLKRFFLAPHLVIKSNCYSDLFAPIYRWYSIVESYVRRGITFESDALPAISALAKEVQSLTGNTYAGGIWIEDFTKGVIWTSFGVAKATQQYRAPSWSWVALKFPREESRRADMFYAKMVEDIDLSKIRKAELLEWHIDTVDGDPFGRLKSGYLRIQGASLPASQWQGKVPPYFNQQDLVSYKSWLFGMDQPLPAQLVCCLDITPTRLFKHRSNTAKIRASGLTNLEGEGDNYLLNRNIAQAQVLDVTLLQIVTISHHSPKDVSIALMLRANEDGTTYRRVGIAEVPNHEDIAGVGWETRDFTIV